MFYKAIGYAVWNLAKAELRRRYGHLRRPAIGIVVGTAIAALYLASRSDDG